MNEENEDFNIEDEINELPGYIQSIINECGTFDKKDCPNQINENKKNDDIKPIIDEDIKEKESSSNKDINNISDNNNINNNIDNFNDDENFFF